MHVLPCKNNFSGGPRFLRHVQVTNHLRWLLNCQPSLRACSERPSFLLATFVSVKSFPFFRFASLIVCQRGRTSTKQQQGQQFQCVGALGRLFKKAGQNSSGEALERFLSKRCVVLLPYIALGLLAKIVQCTFQELSTLDHTNKQQYSGSVQQRFIFSWPSNNFWPQPFWQLECREGCVVVAVPWCQPTFFHFRGSFLRLAKSCELVQELLSCGKCNAQSMQMSPPAILGGRKLIIGEGFLVHVSHSAARRFEYDVAISPSTKCEAGYCCRRYLDADSRVCMPWLLFMLAQIV